MVAGVLAWAVVVDQRAERDRERVCQGAAELPVRTRWSGPSGIVCVRRRGTPQRRSVGSCRAVIRYLVSRRCPAQGKAAEAAEAVHLRELMRWETAVGRCVAVAGGNCDCTAQEVEFVRAMQGVLYPSALKH